MRTTPTFLFNAVLLTAVLLTAALLAPVPAAAAESGPQLAQIYRDWAAGPVQHLMTRAEIDEWKRVGDDEGAEKFIRLFWARRDPAPGDADSEFRREFERRVAFADQRFGHTVDGEEVRGSLTDRGRAFILLGPPRRLQEPGAGGSTVGGDFGSGGDVFGSGGSVASGGGPIGVRGGATERFGVASDEVWIYEGDGRPAFIKKRRLVVTFRTEPGSEEVKIFRGEEAMGHMREAIEAAIVNPDVKLADLGPGAGPALAAKDGGGFGLFGADPLADTAALEALRSALAAGGGELAAHLDAGAFQASDGTWIVPLQVATGPTPPAAGTVLVGELVDAAGESRIAFQIDPEWRESRGQRYVKATVVAPPGDYRLRAGLEAPGGRVLWSSERPVTVPAASGELWLSRVVLAEDIHPMREAQAMLEPWAWMGIAVVPDGDRTFGGGGLLWLYLHACQPALDENGKPKLRLSVQLSGASSYRGPASVDPVKAGDNCWVLATALDLVPDRFPTGDYTLQLTVRDSIAGKTLVTDPVDFKVAAGG